MGLSIVFVILNLISMDGAWWDTNFLHSNTRTLADRYPDLQEVLNRYRMKWFKLYP